MFFRNLFKRKETPFEMLKRVKPELFDTSGKTYNGGIFVDSPDSYHFLENEIELFPDANSVFLNVTDFEHSHLLPLCAFELRLIDSSWKGKGYFIYYYKSQSESISAESLVSEYGDYHVSVFNLTGDKISFAGDKSCFQHSVDELVYWDSVRNDYLKNATKAKDNLKTYLKDRKITIDQIIRQARSHPMWIQSDETPIPITNEEIYFVGQLEVNSLINEDEWIYLFYSPQKRILIQVEQWT